MNRIAIVAAVLLTLTLMISTPAASDSNDSGSPYAGEMIWIPAGSFLMGNSGNGNDKVYGTPDELPQHSVYLSGYSIGKYEVTRGEYRKFIDAGGYTTRAYWSDAGWAWKGSRTKPRFWEARANWGKPPGEFTQGNDRPVVGVTWYEADAFCRWAGGHLPTEAQWERAARWDVRTKHPSVYPWGDTWDERKSNHWTDTLFAGYQTSPVGSYPAGASPCGCQDIAGNVWEWCQDWFARDYYSQSPERDPQGPAAGIYRVLRGSGWDYGGPDDRCAFRDYLNPDGYVNSDGFRLAR